MEMEEDAIRSRIERLRKELLAVNELENIVETNKFPKVAKESITKRKLYDGTRTKSLPLLKKNFVHENRKTYNNHKPTLKRDTTQDMFIHLSKVKQSVSSKDQPTGVKNNKPESNKRGKTEKPTLPDIQNKICNRIIEKCRQEDAELAEEVKSLRTRLDDQATKSIVGPSLKTKSTPETSLPKELLLKSLVGYMIRSINYNAFNAWKAEVSNQIQNEAWFQKHINGVIKVQCVFRCKISRKQTDSLKTENVSRLVLLQRLASIQIQTWSRQCLAKLLVHRLRDIRDADRELAVSITVERVWRSHKARRLVWKNLRESVWQTLKTMIGMKSLDTMLLESKSKTCVYQKQRELFKIISIVMMSKERVPVKQGMTTDLLWANRMSRDVQDSWIKQCAVAEVLKQQNASHQKYLENSIKEEKEKKRREKILLNAQKDLLQGQMEFAIRAEKEKVISEGRQVAYVQSLEYQRVKAIELAQKENERIEKARRIQMDKENEELLAKQTQVLHARIRDANVIFKLKTTEIKQIKLPEQLQKMDFETADFLATFRRLGSENKRQQIDIQKQILAFENLEKLKHEKLERTIAEMIKKQDSMLKESERTGKKITLENFEYELQEMRDSFKVSTREAKGKLEVKLFQIGEAAAEIETRAARFQSDQELKKENSRQAAEKEIQQAVQQHEMDLAMINNSSS